MDLKDLVGRGYFPKELPPPFNTRDLALEISIILSDWVMIFENNTQINSPTFVLTQNTTESNKNFKIRKKEHKANFISKYNSSKGTFFSISKGKLSRRFLQIPNPKHFSQLAEKIVSRWSDYETLFQLSKYSQSYPVLETDPRKRSVLTFSKNVSEFRNSLLNTSIDKLIEVRVDISKFYPTIYTHSIAWGLLGKEKAKNYFIQKDNIEVLINSGDTDAELYKYAESVDTALRACQEKQSIGIPIGPDTSHILSEAIACRIDDIIDTRFNSINLKACRYYDDYYLYVSSKDEADKVLKGLQLILSEFQLEINEAKVKIHEFPFGFEDEFTQAIHSFDFEKSKQLNNIKYYFSMLWKFAEESPNKTDWIFKYALRVFEFSSIVIENENWKVFENLLIKTALVEPAILDILTRIFLTYENYLNSDSKLKLKKLVNATIKEHCSVHHNFEIAWALWISKTFDIEIEEESANQIIKTKDSISNLILLDLINNTNLIQGTPTLSLLEAELKDNILMTEYWLLAYEGVKKGWLTPPETNLLDNNLFFKILKDKNIEFYDPTKQLQIYGTDTTSSQIPPIVNAGILSMY
ncbi:reverse transcriptase domain-containing protein [Acinetobacter bereziniae]|uniref:reverse transcriptase domain-containing protein n=1 Tax=Acinetobacter bereziniae TaxID=106648 RepID=UPI00374F1D8B